MLTYDRTTNKGGMYIINIAKNGKNHTTVESAHQAMKERLGNFGKDAKKEDGILLPRHNEVLEPTIHVHRSEGTTGDFKQYPAVFPMERNNTGMNDKGQKQKLQPTTRKIMSADTQVSPMRIHVPFYLQKLFGIDEKGEKVRVTLPRKTEKNAKPIQPKSKEMQIQKPDKKQEFPHRIQEIMKKQQKG